MVEVSVETTFRNPSHTRQKEWQRATHILRECKQWLVDGWNDGSLSSSITTGDIENPLYSALQNQAIRAAKSDYDDEPVEYTGEQPIEVNNQNWEIHTTENGSIVIGFPCISDWWYTPIHVYDDIEDPIEALLDGDAEKTKLSVWREGDDWKVSFTVSYSDDTSGEETPIGVDVGHNYILAATPDDASAESFLVSGKEYKFVRRYYRSLRESLQQAGALRARNHVGNKEYRRIQDANHTLSKRLVEYASQFENPVIKLEDLEGIRDGSEWHGVHSWPFYELQQFIIYKAEKAGIRVEKIDPQNTSQECSQCGEYAGRDRSRFECPSCGYVRHADLNAAENISQREGEPCTA
ncbi:transposase, IS605 OrfB family, central region [Halovenus aranensis]|uniref:Transposase, IS605 OrfB family, central region n=1 Tax=Halovenus aranensis TaxID=890420 RepID=A0A1G8VUW1_9EURY|nr:RNA-guided endonuclease TnpB family protein [Halovenus aranensis]SDJ69799.1 transposase, IS605 OrfB family, central region [Halovenus aranensis]